MREDKVESLLDECRVIAKRSKCARRKFGAIITDHNGVHLSDGYNGSIRGAYNCGVDVPCGKDLMNEPHYSSYVYCAAIHAEVNSILNAARKGIAVEGCTLFLNSSEDGKCSRPCRNCRRNIVNVGIIDVYWKNNEGETIHEYTSTWIEEENKWMEGRGK